MGFICLMGVVSLFADMTQEGARGIFGAYLGMMGASAAMVGCISGAGELVGYGLRFVTGIIASRSREILVYDCRRVCAGSTCHPLSCFCT